MLTKPLVICAALSLLSVVSAAAQGVDPQALMDRLLRRGEIEDQQRFDDRQQERLRHKQEEAYDGRHCIAAGYAADSPDYYQCVRASAAQRRRDPDFSIYGQPAPGEGTRPRSDCVMLGDGLGGAIVDCN